MKALDRKGLIMTLDQVPTSHKYALFSSGNEDTLLIPVRSGCHSGHWCSTGMVGGPANGQIKIYRTAGDHDRVSGSKRKETCSAPRHFANTDN